MTSAFAAHPSGKCRGHPVLYLVALSSILLAAGVLALCRSGWWIALFFGLGLFLSGFAPREVGRLGQAVLQLQFVGLLVTVPVLLVPIRIRKWFAVVLPLAVTIFVFNECRQEARVSYQIYLHLHELYPYE